MSLMKSHAELLSAKEDFLGRAIQRLGTHPSDYQSELRQVRESRKTSTPRLAAGVLVPLLFRPSVDGGSPGKGQFFFQLIKRSLRVSQPGDLSCPGGMIHPIMDRLLRPLLIHTPLPIMRGPALAYAMDRGHDSLRLMTLFLATALRESWEEIGLFPWRVRFLGPLPAHSLARRPRTIFPLVGFVESPGSLHPNREVEKLVEIPLSSFFKPELIGYFTEPALEPPDTAVPRSPQHPCLIHRNASGGEDILWGATFHVLTRFLQIVLDYQLPDWTKGPVLTKPPRHITSSPVEPARRRFPFFLTEPTRSG
jgi:8-oxo-dGTP pyrophosphatase MutT (NUDIX family)